MSSANVLCRDKIATNVNADEAAVLGMSPHSLSAPPNVDPVIQALRSMAPPSLDNSKLSLSRSKTLLTAIFTSATVLKAKKTVCPPLHFYPMILVLIS